MGGTFLLMVLRESTGEEDSKTGLSTVVELNQRATQMILGSRIVDARNYTVCEDNSEEYGTSVILYENFRQAFWDATDPLLLTQNDSAPSLLFLYIFTENDAAIKEKVLLEKWILQYTPPTISQEEDSQIKNFDACLESAQLLRSLVCATRLLPAFKLFKDYSRKPNHYNLTYSLSHVEIPSANFNTGDVEKYSFPVVSTAQGTLRVTVDYRKDCSKFSKQKSIHIPSVEESYYPQSQIFGDKKEVKKEINNIPSPVIVKPEVPEPTNINEQDSVCETILVSCGSFIIEPVIPIPDDIREFQRTMGQLQDMEMFRNSATYNKNDLANLQRFANIIAK